MVSATSEFNCTNVNSTLYNETVCDFLDSSGVPNGNLTAIANDTGAALGIGIMSILWICLTVFQMIIPWSNSEFTGKYDPPIVYLFSLGWENAMFNSWFPTGYLMAWIFNLVLYLTELFSWFEGRGFFVLWINVCLWGGLILSALPWVAMLLYIYHEWPIR